MTSMLPFHSPLSGDEMKIIHAMRGFLEALENKVNFRPGPAIIRIAEALGRLIELLWRNDPFLVKPRRRHDGAVSLFELQVLYAIAETRIQNAGTVSQLLEWWLPAVQIETGRRYLDAIARSLDCAGMALQSSDRLRRHIVAFALANARSCARVADGGTFHLHYRLETLH